MRFTKKPVTVEAVQFTGGNFEEIVKFTNGAAYPLPGGTTMMIQTFNGTVTASRNDWIVRDVKGGFYPCRADVFEATHEMTV